MVSKGIHIPIVHTFKSTAHRCICRYIDRYVYYERLTAIGMAHSYYIYIILHNTWMVSFCFDGMGFYRSKNEQIEERERERERPTVNFQIKRSGSKRKIVKRTIDLLNVGAFVFKARTINIL